MLPFDPLQTVPLVVVKAAATGVALIVTEVTVEATGVQIAPASCTMAR